MEDKQNNHNTNAVGNGFLLGVIVGVLITLLFTTKRGRIILKELMEKGIKKFSDLEDLMKESKNSAEDEFDEESGDFIPVEQITAPEPPKEKIEPVKKTIEEKKEAKPASQPPEPKPVKKEEPSPKQEEKPQKVKEKEPEKEKPKRWFRGLPRKG